MFKTFALVAALLVGLTGHVSAQAGDFSDGLTGLGNLPVGTEQVERQRQQEAIAKAAEEALGNAPAANTQLAPGQLGAGDKIRLTVFGEEELSGEFEVAGNGQLSLPLSGEVKALGLTASELERAIERKLSQGYLVNPRVSVQVLSFRPFFILGEVNKPGSYPWSNDMTVINAVALGGGYTPRAKTGAVSLRRANDPERREQLVPEDTKINPGDIIRVEERFF